MIRVGAFFLQRIFVLTANAPGHYFGAQYRISRTQLLVFRPMFRFARDEHIFAFKLLGAVDIAVVLTTLAGEVFDINRHELASRFRPVYGLQFDHLHCDLLVVGALHMCL